MWRSASRTAASTLSTFPSKDETKSQRELMSCSWELLRKRPQHMPMLMLMSVWPWIESTEMEIPFLASLFAPDLRKECPEMWSTQIPWASWTCVFNASLQAQHAYAPHVQARLYPQTCQGHRVAQTLGNFSAHRHRQIASTKHNLQRNFRSQTTLSNPCHWLDEYVQYATIQNTWCQPVGLSRVTMIHLIYLDARVCLQVFVWFGVYATWFTNQRYIFASHLNTYTNQPNHL